MGGSDRYPLVEVPGWVWERIDWRRSAIREFAELPDDAKLEFLAVFPELLRHPTRRTPTLDVIRISNEAGAWRLKVPGYRALYVIWAGRPRIEMIQERTESTYREFRRHLRLLGRP